MGKGMPVYLSLIQSIVSFKSISKAHILKIVVFYSPSASTAMPSFSRLQSSCVLSLLRGCLAPSKELVRCRSRPSSATFRTLFVPS